MIKIGMMLGDRYEILEKIGTGGMSDVYKAKDHKLNRFVAVKVLKQEFSENTNFVSKFRVEAQAAASLMHPNIVNVYDVGEENGVHYINGVPVTESPFGKDPFEPVRHSVIAELIGEQCPAPAVSVPVLSDASPLPDQEGILIFDAETDEELSRAGRRLYQESRLSIMAGCAGFGAVLPELLKLAKSERQPLPKLDPKLLVVCGSVNPITLAQLDHAERNGFSRLRLTPKQKLEPGYWQSQEGKEAILKIQDMLAANDRCIIESNDAGGNGPTAGYAKELGIDLETLRVRIAGSLGYLVGQIFTCPSLGTLLLTGGDTLLQCMNCLGVHRLEPVCELEKGVVLASFTYQGCTRHVITKSGGFGTEGLFTGLSKQIIDMEGKP